jgi:CubicO group peptidase (beta-lactamase class C family)
VFDASSERERCDPPFRGTTGAMNEMKPWRRAGALLLCLLATARVGHASSCDPHCDWAAVDRYVAAEMAATHVPGAALAVVEGSRIAYQKGYGIADPAGRPVTPRTPFVLGSLSKSFTAVAVMQLVERHALELDAPVRRYLPWFSVADRDASRSITVRHLLNQTSGLPEAAGIDGLADGDTSDGALERRVRQLARVRPTSALGTFQYCNSNYDTLGLLVQVVSGQPYEAYVQRHIFEPLEMAHSFTSRAAAREGGLATGYRLWFGVPIPAPRVPFARGSLPSGYLISSAEDMAHYLSAHVEGGRNGESTLVSPASLAELHRAAATPRFRDTRTYAGYAMGWFTGEKAGTRVLHHGGSTPTFMTEMVLVPEKRLALVVLTNAFTANRLAEGVLDVVLGREPPAVESRPPLGVEWLWLPLGQLLTLVVSLALLRRWKPRPTRSTPSWGAWSCLAALALLDAAVLLLTVRELATRDLPLRVSLLFFPALTWLPLACAAFAAVWGATRTVWGVKLLRASAAR